MSDLQRVIYNKTLLMSETTRVADRISLILSQWTNNNRWTSHNLEIALTGLSKPKLAAYHQIKTRVRAQRICLDQVRDLLIN